MFVSMCGPVTDGQTDGRSKCPLSHPLTAVISAPAPQQPEVDRLCYRELKKVVNQELGGVSILVCFFFVFFIRFNQAPQKGFVHNVVSDDTDRMHLFIGAKVADK